MDNKPQLHKFSNPAITTPTVIFIQLNPNVSKALTYPDLGRGEGPGGQKAKKKKLAFWSIQRLRPSLSISIKIWRLSMRLLQNVLWVPPPRRTAVAFLINHLSRDSLERMPRGVLFRPLPFLCLQEPFLLFETRGVTYES